MVCVHTLVGSVSSALRCLPRSNLCIQASSFPSDQPIMESGENPPCNTSDESNSSRIAPLPSLQEVCSTHIPLVRRITLEVAAEIAELFRLALRCALWTVAFRSRLEKRNLTIVLHPCGKIRSVDKTSKRLTWPAVQPVFCLG